MNKLPELSEKHGVNPTILTCPVCEREHAIAFFGKWDKQDEQGRVIERDVKAPRHSPEPCPDCSKVLEADGTLIIEVLNGDHGKPADRARRTGYIVGTKQRLHPGSNVVFMEEHALMELMGPLYRVDVNPDD